MACLWQEVDLGGRTCMRAKSEGKPSLPKEQSDSKHLQALEGILYQAR